MGFKHIPTLCVVQFLDDGPLLNAMFVGSYSIYVFLLLFQVETKIRDAEKRLEKQL